MILSAESASLSLAPSAQPTTRLRVTQDVPPSTVALPRSCPETTRPSWSLPLPVERDRATDRLNGGAGPSARRAVEHRCGALRRARAARWPSRIAAWRNGLDELVRRYVGRLLIRAAMTVLVLSATDGTFHRERVVGACDFRQPSVAAATGGRPPGVVAPVLRPAERPVARLGWDPIDHTGDGMAHA